MENFLDKFFFRSKNLDYISQNIKDITFQTPANKIFDAINSFSEKSEVRYVGGFIRKIVKKEVIDDIDLATNLKPSEVCEALKNKNINFYETGIEHGTVTAIIDEYKYEITSLRKDLTTDGRHAKVEFSSDWKEDSLRRDFSINSIYSDQDGNLFDPNNGKKDLEDGRINFIGDVETRIKEDYLRILRYIRFFINYSKHKHKPEIIKIIKKNIDGVYKLSNDRLLDEFKKLTKSNNFLKLSGPTDKQILRPTELQRENRPPTQSFIEKIFFSEMPKAVTFSKLEETAIKCCLMALSGAWVKNHFLIELALLSVSWVVKLFETTIKRVVSGSICLIISSTWSPSTLETKVMAKWFL